MVLSCYKQGDEKDIYIEEIDGGCFDPSKSNK